MPNSPPDPRPDQAARLVALGVSASALARHIGLSTRTCQRWLRGEVFLADVTIDRLYAYLRELQAVASAVHGQPARRLELVPPP
jgi:hypothetical protein